MRCSTSTNRGMAPISLVFASMGRVSIQTAALLDTNVARWANRISITQAVGLFIRGFDLLYLGMAPLVEFCQAFSIDSKQSNGQIYGVESASTMFGFDLSVKCASRLLCIEAQQCVS